MLGLRRLFLRSGSPQCTRSSKKPSLSPSPPTELLPGHEAPGTLQKLIPPGEPIRIKEHTGGIKNGARVVLQMGPIRWIAVHEGYRKGRQFQDRQQSGPLHYWLHTHLFEPTGETTCKLIDHVEFELPLSPLSNIVLPMVRRKLEKTFAYRHQVTLAALTPAAEPTPPSRPEPPAKQVFDQS